MGAAEAVRAGIVAALRGDAGFAELASGVFDGAPRRAAFPYAALGETVASDWSAQGVIGRELRVAVLVIDDGEVPARLHGLVAVVEAAVAGMARALAGGWRVASCVVLKTRVARGSGGLIGTVDVRVRVSLG